MANGIYTFKRINKAEFDITEFKIMHQTRLLWKILHCAIDYPEKCRQSPKIAPLIKEHCEESTIHCFEDSKIYFNRIFNFFLVCIEVDLLRKASLYARRFIVWMIKQIKVCSKPKTYFVKPPTYERILVVTIFRKYQISNLSGKLRIQV